MHPTVDEQLRGIRRLLQIVVADEPLSPSSTEVLADATRMLRRLEASWGHVLAFLVADNQAMVGLLSDVAPLLGADLGTDIAATLAAHRAAPGQRDLDVGVAHERNMALRALLARAVTTLPDDDTGRSARVAITAHLRQRLDRHPMLGRLGGD